MQGIKRKATTSGERGPLKLKKQSTSTKVDNAEVTLKKARSVRINASKAKQQSTDGERPKAVVKKGTSADKQSPLPRFPTLVPTKKVSNERGIKRKASTTGVRGPLKLKKQSTSATIDKALVTLKKAKSIKLNASKPKTKLQLKDGTRLKAVVKHVKPGNKLLPLPRFPTLVPSTLSKLSEFSLDDDSYTKIALQKKATVIISAEKEEEMIKKFPHFNDPLNTRASKIKTNLLKLPSGSVVSRIMHIDHLDGIGLPSDASLAIYECTTPIEEKTPLLPISRPSLFDVMTEINHIEKEKTPEMPILPMGDNGIASEPTESTVPTLNPIAEEPEDEFDLPPVLEAELPLPPQLDQPSEPEPYAFGFGENEDVNTESVTGITSSPAKTPSKSPRKMTGSTREIVISFDTTGSMYDYLEEARDRIKELVTRIQEEMPGVRLAFIAHGDYYDLKNDRYLIKFIDFGATLEEIVNFFDCLPITHGGDADECYELVLRKAQESLSWTPDSQKSLIMIGDSDPHELGYKYEDFVNDIDWKEEANNLNEMVCI